MNLEGNTNDDDGLIELCDTILIAHNVTIEHLVLEDTQIGDRGIEYLISTMRRVASLWDVKCDTLKLSQGVRDTLNALGQKNRVLFEEAKILHELT